VIEQGGARAGGAARGRAGAGRASLPSGAGGVPPG
jgi:hypothetical protein